MEKSRPAQVGNRTGPSSPNGRVTPIAPWQWIKQVTVQVPATSANLGPGFDVLGVALDLTNTITVEAAALAGHKMSSVEIDVTGEGSSHLPMDGYNLTYRALRHFYAAQGAVVPPVRLILHNQIPVGRGLGSSAAAIVGGLLAAQALLDRPIDLNSLLRLALDLESHPDNLAAALWGGFTVAVAAPTATPLPASTGATGERGKSEPAGAPIVRVVTPADVQEKLRVVLLIPASHASTSHARAVLSTQVSRADAVFNLGRLSLLLTALHSGDFTLLGPAMEDRLHQPQRASLFPLLDDAIAAARHAGAYGAALSGAGSTVLAFAVPDRAEAIAAAMAATAPAHRIPVQTVIATISTRGATVTSITPSSGRKDQAV